MELECEVCGCKVEVDDTKAEILLYLKQEYPSNIRFICKICQGKLKVGES